MAKTAIVTGASGGIGRQIAERLGGHEVRRLCPQSSVARVLVVDETASGGDTNVQDTAAQDANLTS